MSVGSADLLRHHFASDSETFDSSWDAAIRGDLVEHRAQLLVCEAVPDGRIEVQLPFVHAAERSNHSEVDHGSLSVRERVIRPGQSPAEFGDDFLELSVEIVGCGQTGLDEVFSEDCLAGGESLVESFCGHDVPFTLASFDSSRD